MSHFPQDSELPLLLEDQIKGTVSSLYSQYIRQGQELNKHLWKKTNEWDENYMIQCSFTDHTWDNFFWKYDMKVIVTLPKQEPESIEHILQQ